MFIFKSCSLLHIYEVFNPVGGLIVWPYSETFSRDVFLQGGVSEPEKEGSSGHDSY
jgi:hypothetical protein